MTVIVMLTMLLGAGVSLVTIYIQAVLLPTPTGAVAEIGAGIGVFAVAAGVVLQSINTALIYGLPCVGLALFQAWLLEIKEGAGIERLQAGGSAGGRVWAARVATVRSLG